MKERGKKIGYIAGMSVGLVTAYYLWGFSSPGGILILLGAGGGGLTGGALEKYFDEFDNKRKKIAYVKVFAYTSVSFSALFGIIILSAFLFGKVSLFKTIVSCFGSGICFGTIVSIFITPSMIRRYYDDIYQKVE